MKLLNKLLIIIVPTVVFGLTPFDTPKGVQYNLSVFNTKSTNKNTKAMKNKKVKCRYVCDKKVYKEQKITAAISFYKENTSTK